MKELESSEQTILKMNCYKKFYSAKCNSKCFNAKRVVEQITSPRVKKKKRI